MANLETKLKALLAAGLIGTAGLGMQSCSNPSDSVYYPYTVEAPSTDNPGSGGAETSNPSGGEENGSNGVETVDKFEELGVTDDDAKRRIANAGKLDFIEEVDSDYLTNRISGSLKFIYIKGSFQSNIPEELPSDYNNGAYKYGCVDGGAIYNYIIPADLINRFGEAIEAYKASHNQ